MKFPFFKIGAPKTITWEELSKNILDSIERERREKMPPSSPLIESDLLPSLGGSVPTQANTSVFSNAGTAIDDLYPTEESVERSTEA